MWLIKSLNLSNTLLLHPIKQTTITIWSIFEALYHPNASGVIVTKDGTKDPIVYLLLKATLSLKNWYNHLIII